MIRLYRGSHKPRWPLWVDLRWTIESASRYPWQIVIYLN